MSDNVVAFARSAEPEPTKAGKFRGLLESPDLEFIMEAHNGLSAKIAEEAGFKGLWASGLSISTALGVRDRNEASWTQVLEVLEFMSDATEVPILLDGDTGYGDFNNFRRLVRKLCQRDIAAVCIEDKIFPKTNSFLDGDQSLADVEEFCGKIKAGKDSQTDDSFSIVARVEALIAGWGMDEALKRAEAYRAAGADAILIHSKLRVADEILAFAREWDNRCPLVIVPTTYYATPTNRYRDADISLVIWANHNLRTSITAMRKTSRQIFEQETLIGVEDDIATLRDVFAIAGNSELAEAERKYLLSDRQETNAVVLAASRGSALTAVTKDKPKCMLDLHGEPLLRRLTRSFNAAGIRDITVVCGYQADAVDLPKIRKVTNEAYEASGEIESLACALDRVTDSCVISYGDIVFRDFIPDLLMDSEADIALIVDAASPEMRRATPKHTADLVTCSRPYSDDVFLDEAPITLRHMDPELSPESAHGEWIGLAKVSGAGARHIHEEVAAMRTDGTATQAGLPDLFNRLAARNVAVEVIYVVGHWMDINDAFDLARARNDF